MISETPKIQTGVWPHDWGLNSGNWRLISIDTGRPLVYPNTKQFSARKIEIIPNVNTNQRKRSYHAP